MWVPILQRGNFSRVFVCRGRVWRENRYYWPIILNNIILPYNSARKNEEVDDFGKTSLGIESRDE